MSYLLDIAKKNLAEIYGEDYTSFNDYGPKDLEEVYMLGYMDARRRYKTDNKECKMANGCNCGAGQGSRDCTCPDQGSSPIR
jgi:hypothetical protein